MSKKLVNILGDIDASARNQSARLRTAVLTSTLSGVAEIVLAGATVYEVPYLASYTPTNGDTVLLLQTDAGQLVIIGKLA